MKMIGSVVFALAIAAVLLIAFSRVAAKRPGKVNLGSRQFVIRELEQRKQDAVTGPLFFNDLVQDERSLPLALVYLGKDQWAALNALAPGQPEKCVVEWDLDRKVFRDLCSNIDYAPDGKRDDGGPPLIRYAANADKDADRLVVDLNVAYADSIRSAPPS
jgi:hypothetical protein